MQSLNQEIRDLISSRQLDKAFECLDSAPESFQQEADFYYYKAICHYFKGEMNPTLTHLQQALKINSKHTDAAICLSVLLNDIGQYDSAKQAFETANASIESDSENQKVNEQFALKHLELGDMYSRFKRFDEAIEQYSKASALNPQALEYRIKRAKAYAKKGFLTRSLQELHQIKLQYPDCFEARHQLGLLHYSQGNLIDAELEWESILAQDPTNALAIQYLQMSKSSRYQ